MSSSELSLKPSSGSWPADVRHIVQASDRSVDEVDDADRRLAELGCQPVFKREFNYWSCFSFALSISGLYATVMVTFSYPLLAGGAASVVWCWLIGGIGTLTLALSIAEISSAYPTSGGMYFTIKYLCPSDYVPIVAWISGWLNLTGTVAGTASAEYGSAQMLLSSVSIATGFQYRPTQAQTIGVMALLCVAHGLVNSMSTRWLNKISGTYAIVHIAVLLGAVLALLAVDRNKHNPEYVFTHLEPQSGWSPPGFSFWFGCLSVSWIIANCDGVGHIAEETKNPSKVVPFAITSSAVFTYVVGFLYNIVLVFCMGNPRELLSTPTGMPVTQIFYNVMGPAPAVLLSMAGFLIMNIVCIPSMHAGSRTIWAFARDELLPLSRVWFRMNSRTGTPVPAVWLYVALCITVNLIGLGSHILMAAIFNVCAVALNWSYCIPILCKLIYPTRFEKGAWSLGMFGTFMNVYSIIWNVFLSVIFMLPTVRPVTTDNMNYASVVLAVTLLISVIYWYLRGKRYYTGPRTRATTVPHGGIVVTDEVASGHDPEKMVMVHEDLATTSEAVIRVDADEARVNNSETSSTVTVVDTASGLEEAKRSSSDLQRALHTDSTTTLQQ